MRSRGRFLSAATLIIGLTIAAAPGVASAGSGTGTLRQSPALADELLVRVNALRASVGSPPLTRDPAVDAFALRWSATMAESARLVHNPNLAQIPGSWRKAGENVGVGMQLQAIFDAFVRSPHHYPNLVDPAFTITGIAVVVDPAGELWVTQNFEQLMAPRPVVSRPSAPAPPAPAPPPAVVPPPPPLPPPVVPARLSFALRALSGSDPDF